MELNRRRRGLIISALVVWSVAGLLVFSRWSSVVRYFSMESDITAATDAGALRSQSQTSRKRISPIQGKKTMGRPTWQSMDKANRVIFVPVPADELALRVDDVVEGNSSASVNFLLGGKVRESSTVARRINAGGMNRSAGWELLNSLVNKLDFRAVARYPLDEYLTTMDQEILADEPVEDLTTIASPKTSRLELVGLRRQRRKVNVGENVTVRVILKDIKGRRVLKGGHSVRVWMVSEGAVKRSAAVDVFDLRNGTYVASLPILWPGRVEVRAAVQRSRAFRRAALSALNNMKNMLHVLAHFVSGTKKEVTLCSYIPVVPGYPEVCNLTTLNSGLPWYCGRPSVPGLKCRDWAAVSILTYPERYEVTDSENAILLPYVNISNYKSGKLHQKTRKLPQTILLTAVQGPPGKGTPHVDPKSCRPLEPRETWEDQSPRGFWEDGQWRPLTGCPLPEVNRSVLLECFHDRSVLFLGDSNARKVKEAMEFYARCAEQNQEGFTQKDAPRAFHCPGQKLQLSTIFHAYPYFSGFRKWRRFGDNVSPDRVLDSLSATGRYVIMIHLYMHFAVQHIYIYTLHVRDAARGVRDLLKRNPRVKVFLRGPHALDFGNVAFQSDVHASRSLRVLQHEFRDLRDQVVFLNMMDMTVANENCNVHPNEDVVRTVCQMIVSYVCPK